MNDLERQLAGQEFKPAPREWRATILNAAHGARDVSEAATAGVPWWRLWLWPSPRAWVTLAGLWALILLGHLTMPSVDSPRTAAAFTGGAGAAEAWREQQQLLADLFPPERRVEPPKAMPPRRRSERESDFFFV